MSITTPIAHDFICPWCWVGLLQARKLKAEFGIQLEWNGYELFPDELEWPDYPAAAPAPANKPATPTRFEFLLLADGIEMPTAERPKKMRTHNAHEAVEFAKTLGKADELIDVLYEAYWLRGENINDVPTLLNISEPVLGHRDELQQAIETRRFKDKIVGFDDDAYSVGVYNVPTFFVGEKRLAEQPYVVLEKEIAAAKG